MKIHRSLVALASGTLLGSGALLATLPAYAAEPMPANYVAPAQRNAAIRYLIAVSYLTPEMGEELKAIDWEKLGTSIDPAKMTTEFNDAAKQNFDQVLQWTVDGTTMSKCNFESNYEAGVGTLLPQLAQMRQLARALRLDARINLKNGDADKAADRVMQMLRLGSHLQQDSWLISVLVGAAVQQPAFHEAVAVASSPNLSEAKRRELIAALQALDTPDPIHYQDAISVERRSIIAWLEKESAAPGAWQRIKPQLIEEGGPGSDLSLTDEEVRKQIGQLGSAYDAFAIAAKGTTSDADAAKFFERSQSGEWGTLSKMMMPGLEALRASERRYKEALAKAIAALQSPAGK
ncbi:MAG: hypothetical protein KF691_05500 [Phycisphaeraceae bacterium]|nr:hypothetical protein [Phycisphaeraceae bacterium]